MALPKWTDERTQQLVDFVGGESPISQATVANAAEDLETSTPVKENRLSLLESIDNLSYRTISFGFPMLTIGIIAGAVWANEAWGSSVSYTHLTLPTICSV